MFLTGAEPECFTGSEPECFDGEISFPLSFSLPISHAALLSLPSTFSHRIVTGDKAEPQYESACCLPNQLLSSVLLCCQDDDILPLGLIGLVLGQMTEQICDRGVINSVLHCPELDRQCCAELTSLRSICSTSNHLIAICIERRRESVSPVPGHYFFFEGPLLHNVWTGDMPDNLKSLAPRTTIVLSVVGYYDGLKWDMGPNAQVVAIKPLPVEELRRLLGEPLMNSGVIHNQPPCAPGGSTVKWQSPSAGRLKLTDHYGVLPQLIKKKLLTYFEKQSVFCYPKSSSKLAGLGENLFRVVGVQGAEILQMNRTLGKNSTA